MSAAALLEVRRLRVRRGGVDLLDVPALNVAGGETLALIGPNGAGKSTLLLGLSGIEPPAAGELIFRGERVPAGAAALAYRRRVAMVFQEPLLFDTTVFENVASGLRLRGVAKGEIERRVGENLERFRVAHLSKRPARTLSGGEAQRTSLARGLAVAPEVLLLVPGDQFPPGTCGTCRPARAWDGGRRPGYRCQWSWPRPPRSVIPGLLL